jgi:hypothetical protein
VEFKRIFGREHHHLLMMAGLPRVKGSGTVCSAGLERLWKMPKEYLEVELTLSTEETDDAFCVLERDPNLEDSWPTLLADYGSGVEHEIFGLELDDIVRECFKAAGHPRCMWATISVVK